MKLIKISVASILSIFTSLTLQAEELNLKCYNALNPQVVTIINMDNDDKEVAESVQIQTYIDVTKYDETVYKTPVMKVTAKSKTMLFSTVAIKEKGSKYQVECDGGSAKAITIGKIMVLNTAYLAGDVITDDEGCASGKIEASDLALHEETCEVK